jgi:DNA-binding Lrp family transcriptional regulator
MSELFKVATVLERTKRKGPVTASYIAKAANMPRENVRKRIYDLKTLRGFKISTELKKYGSKTKAYYRITA